MFKISLLSICALLMLTGCNVNVENTGGGLVTSEDGKISCGETCTASYETSLDVVLEAIPDEGYVFEGWVGDCTGTLECTVSIGKYSGHKNVSATFSGVDTDNDGAFDVVDSFPLNPLCWLPEHDDGEGNCYDASTIPSFNPTNVLADDKIVYLFSAEHKAVYRWVAEGETFIWPIKVGNEEGSPTSVVYSGEHQRLYFSYSTGEITFIDLSGSLGEQAFANTLESTNGLAAVGDYVLAQDNSGAWESHYVFDVEGNQTAYEDWNHYSREYAWNDVNSRVYFFRDTSSPNDLMYEEIDQNTGAINSSGETPYHGDYSIVDPIRVSVNGGLVLLGSGDLYDADDLTWQGSIGAIEDALWIDSGDVLAINQFDGQYRLTRRDSSFNRVEVVIYDGAALALLQVGSDIVTVGKVNNTFAFEIYTPSDDSDGDGVDNLSDAFPLDAAASLDSDNDGYPDAWNAGYGEADSTTGLSLDIFPEDSACWFEAHGDGVDSCDFGATMPQFAPDEIVSDSNGILYIFNASNGSVYRWSVDVESYLNPIHVGESSVLTTDLPSKMAYSEEHQRLYFGYNGGEITYVDLTGDLVEQVFAHTAMSVRGLAAVGNYVLAQDSSGAWNTHYIFDVNGVLTDSEDWNRYSLEYAWNEANSRVYFFRNGTSPNDLHYEEIDQSTGVINSSGESPYHGGHSIVNPIRVSVNGGLVLLGSGDLYDADDLTWQGSIGAIEDALWIDSGDVLAINQFDGQYRLTRRDSSFNRVEVVIYDGAALALLQVGSDIVTVGKVNNTFAFEIYTPSDDSDGDGVDNLSDAFPLDAAASLDSDNDGYPDAWNAGYGEADSTAGLTLDLYLYDSACWLADHDDGMGMCDFSATMPEFTPAEILSDSNGTLYLFNTENGVVYRWSVATQSYLNPIYTGEGSPIFTNRPSKMAYSSEHQRLYFGYSTGDITFIDLTGDLVEQSFANEGISVKGLAAAGNYLAVSASGGHLYDIDGNSIAANVRNSRDYAWNENNSRLYFFRDGSSPNDLLYLEVDSLTGETIASGETPYHGDYSIVDPIRVSVSGDLVLLGSGDLYDADDLTWQGSIGAIEDALWLDSGHVLAINQFDGQYRLTRRDSSFNRVEVAVYDGAALALLQVGSDIVTVGEVNNTFAFEIYTPSDDSDGDGVDNLSDAFPLDAAASLDSDNDGYPDAWNEGYSEEDSITGLNLDTFPEDSACWFEAHGDGAGSCDFGATMPQFTPDEIVSDSNGILYIFNVNNSSVYRWSVDAESYLNPIHVGESNVLTTDLPSKMAYSEEHQRLYFGYNSGEITYVDLTGDLVEQAFAHTAMSVRGLTAVGDYVLAQDNSGAWYTHYIFDVNGALTDSEDWNRYSLQYAWNEANSRVYFFRNGTSPNDLHYEEIDQENGLISGKGETPYHSSANISLPIRVVNNGQHILLGSGKVYDAESLSLSEYSVPVISDAVAFSELMAVARADDDQWSVELYNYVDFGFETNFLFDNEILAVFGREDRVVVVESNAGEFMFSMIELGDADKDGMPAWWENKFGLSDSDGSDAMSDNDLDGVNNIEEYLQGINPTAGDSDSDGVSDYDEIYVYHTTPSSFDSDIDGLGDGDEIFIHLTDPNDKDSDGDGFLDGEELIKYGTDPNSGQSIPQALTDFTEVFEGEGFPVTWTAVETSHADWQLAASEYSEGSQSIKSGVIGHSQNSAVVFSGLFASGSLSFDAKVEAESCCDRLRVYVDGVQLHNISSGDWASYSIDITAGEHSVEWRYQKDGSVSTAADAAWIDNVSFAP